MVRSGRLLVRLENETEGKGLEAYLARKETVMLKGFVVPRRLYAHDIASLTTIAHMAAVVESATELDVLLVSHYMLRIPLSKREVRFHRVALLATALRMATGVSRSRSWRLAVVSIRQGEPYTRQIHTLGLRELAHDYHEGDEPQWYIPGADGRRDLSGIELAV